MNPSSSCLRGWDAHADAKAGTTCSRASRGSSIKLLLFCRDLVKLSVQLAKVGREVVL